MHNVKNQDNTPTVAVQPHDDHPTHLSEDPSNLVSLFDSLTVSDDQWNSSTERTSVQTSPAHRVVNTTAPNDINQGATTGYSTGEFNIDYTKFEHVIELFAFRKELTTDDLQAELATFKDSGFYLKWVDDEHCLAVFSSPTEAKRALSQISGLLLEARLIKDASSESKRKLTKSPGDWAMPYKKRPQTTCATAHRLITGHLGLSPSPKSPEQLERERRDKEALVEARAQHERRKMAQKFIWESESLNFPCN